MTQEACRYAILAAADAEQVGAVGVVGLQTQRALRLGNHLEPRERFELLLQSSRASNFASTRLQDAVDPAEEAIRLAMRIGDPVMEGRALIVLAWALWSLDRVVQARDAAERAVMLAVERSSDISALAHAHATHVRIQVTAFDPQVAIDDGPRALELASGPGFEETRIGIEISIALARGHRGDAGALDALSAACKAAREAGLAIQTVRAYVNLVLVAALLRRHAFVDATAREALALFENYQTTIPANAIQLFRARSLFDRGSWGRGPRDRRSRACRLRRREGERAGAAGTGRGPPRAWRGAAPDRFGLGGDPAGRAREARGRDCSGPCRSRPHGYAATRWRRCACCGRASRHRWPDGSHGVPANWLSGVSGTRSTVSACPSIRDGCCSWAPAVGEGFYPS